MTVTFAVDFVSDRSWKSGLDAGKLAPAFTASAVPLTEMTAEVGAATAAAGVFEPALLFAGTFAGAAVAAGVFVPLDFAGAAAGVADFENGSLLVNSLNDWSCPTPALGTTAE